MALQVRERKNGYVCYLVLLATLSGYETLVGTHNTVYVRRMWQALPCLPGMANVGAYNTVYALTHLEGYIVPV